MADKPQTPPEPPQGELTERDDTWGHIATPYINLLTTDDSVLINRGGDYTLYRETLRDDGCAAPFAQRRLAVTKCETVVDPGGGDKASALDIQAADWLREQLQELDWDRITDGMLYARWYGHAVAECLWQPDLTEGKVTLADIRVRDRSRFTYANDRGPPFIWDRATAKWVRLPERKMWTLSTGADHDDSPYGLGLAHYCYWPVFFKRNNIQFWLTFLEKFASPTAVGRMPPGQFTNVVERNKVMAALQALASQSYTVVPDGTTIELLSSARSGTQDYDSMRRAMDNAMAKLIVGQTASSEGTPGKLGNEDLQGEVRADLIKADADMVCSSFNNTVVTWLTEWNFPGAKPPKVWRSVEPPEDLTERAERDGKIFALGYEPDEAYITETYGPGWKKKAVQDTGLPLNGPNGLIGKAAADFAELGTIAAMRNGHRADQQALLEASQAFANNYADHIGTRVQELLAQAEETHDFETFRGKLLDMMAEPAPPQLAESVARGSVVARLMGLFRGQR